MSTPDNDPQHALPHRRSPKALDDKILAYAREQAPKRVCSTHGWMQWAALASVCVVTVLIVLPEDPSSLTAPQPTQLALEEADQAPAAFNVERTEQAAAPVTATPSPPRPAGLVDRLSSNQGASLAQKEAKRLQESTDVRPLLKRQQTESLARYAPASTMADRAAVADAAPVPAWLEQWLDARRDIQTLLDQDKRQEALATYDRFRKACAECDLPATMDEALVKLPTETPD